MKTSEPTTQQLIKPKLRDIGVLEAEQVIKRALAEYIRKSDVLQSCITCMYFNESTEFCKKYLAKPPARVIAYACESYDDDEIPF